MILSFLCTFFFIKKFIDMKMLLETARREGKMRADLLQESDYVPRKLVTFQLKCTTNRRHAKCIAQT